MKFDVLYVDPPWQYNNKKMGGSHKSGASQKYTTMSLQQLIDLKQYIDPVVKNNSCLFLWGTTPMLPEAFQLMKAWGYKYKTLFTWDKGGYKTGYWFRGQTEHCLFGIKGRVAAFRSGEKNIFFEKSESHSKKPIAMWGIIKKVLWNKEVLELFATQQSKPLWTRIGKEVTGNDIIFDLKQLVHDHYVIKS